MGLMLVLSGCSAAVTRGGGDILAIGDSVMAWNESSDAAIPDAVARTLDREVISRAVPGAQFDNASGLASAVGFDIRNQYPGGTWNWIIVNGGANDLWADCGCGACGPVVDKLISADAKSGSIPRFLRQLRASGAQVLWMGYYKGNGRGSFKGCRDDLVRMEERIARFALATPGVYFVDAEDVLDPEDPASFARDNNHPSPKGAAVIGAYLAQTISAQSGRSQ